MVTLEYPAATSALIDSCQLLWNECQPLCWPKKVECSPCYVATIVAGTTAMSKPVCACSFVSNLRWRGAFVQESGFDDCAAVVADGFQSEFWGLTLSVTAWNPCSVICDSMPTSVVTLWATLAATFSGTAPLLALRSKESGTVRVQPNERLPSWSVAQISHATVMRSFFILLTWSVVTTHQVL